MKTALYSAVITMLALIMILPSAANQTVHLDLLSKCALDVNSKLPAGEMVGARPTRALNNVSVRVTNYDGEYLRTETCLGDVK